MTLLLGWPKNHDFHGQTTLKHSVVKAISNGSLLIDDVLDVWGDAAAPMGQR